jgi:polyisoprenoid-binding protein YceI
MKKLAIIAAVVPVLALALAYREATAFTFKDPKGVNVIRFTLDGRLEQLSGWTSGVSGDMTFDPADPTSLKGKVVVDAATMEMSHTNMTGHMKSELWLDVAKHPTITFESKKVANVKKLDGPDPAWTMDVTGDFTLKGVTKSITVPVRVTHLPGQLARRNRGPGDVTVVRSSFSINRREYGVEGNQHVDIVADEVQVSFSIGAFAPTTY